MRCSNCGWDNPNGLSKCEKCGTPLAAGNSQQSSSASVSPAEYAGTAVESSRAESPFSKTVNEASVFGGSDPEAPIMSPSANDGRCPECGYPLRPRVSVCPKCHHLIGHNGSLAAKIGGNSTQRETPDAVRDKPSTPTNFGGTVMPGMNITPDIWFSLTPQPLLNERETPEKVEFEGKHHELNRANIDPKNHTITSKVQAVMDYDEEKKKWYIQDKSALQYTFLHCTGDILLMDSDVLLMGDRKFIFHAEQSQPDAEPQDFTGTIAAGRLRVNVPRCRLVPMVEEYEQDAPQEHLFRGNVHQLNRANLDPENHTITSHIQAELKYEDGHWYIKDCSQLQTTYILCKDPMDLKDGDRLLMGNRVFVFNC